MPGPQDASCDRQVTQSGDSLAGLTPLFCYDPSTLRDAVRLVPLLFVLLALGDASGGAGQGAAELERTVIELRDRALGDDRAHVLLRSLTVEVGHRLAGSAGDRAAVAWATRKLTELGFDEVRTEPVTVPHWVRGGATGRILAPYPHETVLLALGGSVGTPDWGITAEVVGVPDLEALAELPEQQVRGKIVFVDRKTERTRSGRGYGEAGAVRRNGPADAGAKGAAAILIRSIGTGNHRFAHTGSTVYRDDVPRIPAAALAVPDADVLAAQLHSGREVRFHLELGSHYRPDAQSANVIAEIRGREKPDEIVLLGAHLDSWDVGTGAHDDGAGCAILMSAARLIADLPQPPRRTIRVVLFANEEFGLSGAHAYAEAHADELPAHQLALESDLGGDRVWAFATRVNPRALPEAERIAELIAPLGIEALADEAQGGADFIPLRPANVPLADLRQDATRYFDYHHTLDDTFDKIDPEALAQNVAAYAAIAYWAAETPTSFTPAPPRESVAAGR